MTERIDYHKGSQKFNKALEYAEKISYFVIPSGEEKIVDSIREFALKRNVVTEKQFSYLENVFMKYK